MTTSERQFGILGAGRLAERVAERWWAACGVQASVWSRRFVGDHAISPRLADRPLSVGNLADLLRRPVVYVAVPARAIRELAAAHRAFSDYQGTLLVAAIDVTLEEVQSLCPSALMVRVAPFLLPGQNEIPCLAFAPRQDDVRWSACAKVLLEKLGPVDLVPNEVAFETLLNFGSPFPVVLEKALHRGVSEVLSLRHVDPELTMLAERLLSRGLAAIGSTRHDGDSVAAEQEVATPGGITERGLQEVESLAEAFADVMLKMLRHMEATKPQGRCSVPRRQATP